MSKFPRDFIEISVSFRRKMTCTGGNFDFYKLGVSSSLSKSVTAEVNDAKAIRVRVHVFFTRKFCATFYLPNF